MGDRGNVVVKTKDGEVWLYSHWAGTDLPTMVRDALKRGRERWDDAPYFARIVFDEMTNGTRELTGFGIYPRLTDNEHAILVLWPEENAVSLHAEGGSETATGLGVERKRWTMADFAGLSGEECERLGNVGRNGEAG